VPDSYALTKDQRAFAFARGIPPVLEIDPGAVVTFETGSEAYERLAAGEPVEAIGLENFNAVTGPVLVRGAEPGDALAIDVLAVTVRRAWSVWLPEFGGLGDRTTEIRVREIPLEDGVARIADGLTVPVEPMIGCIGVAPADGESSTLMPAYPWGGNMDLRELEPGTTLYLPVQVPGALLAMGDLHAAMGAAEPTWVSLEASGQATLRIRLEKGLTIPFPRVRLDGATACLGLGATLEEAHQAALDHAFDLLLAGGLDAFDAYAFASARVAMRFGGPASPIVLAVVPDR
jgi:amidase